MRIQLHKGQDGPDILTCQRVDGSVYTAVLAPRSVYHDLAHYVVERTLGLGNGFWGMLAQGGTLESYELPGLQIGPEGYRAEFLATLVQSAVPTGLVSPAYVEMLQQASLAQGLPFPELPSEEVMRDMVAETQAFTRAWEETFGVMELEF